MLANASGTYSIMIRANLESDDILITSNNQLAFGQKLQVCCFVNMNSIQLAKKNKTWGGQQCLNTEKYGTWSDWPRKYRIQNTTVQNTEYNFRSSWGSATTSPLWTTSRRTSSTTGWSSARRGDLESQQRLYARIVSTQCWLDVQKIVGIRQLG